ncbi:hypothetical protein CBL_01877 [Carabus blaptoides fortunei]
MDIPEELQLRIRPRTTTKKVGTVKVTVDKATQARAPIYANRQGNLYRAGKYIGWSDNGVNHIFIPNIDKDHSNMRREIHDKFLISDENIHVVSLQAYTTMNNVINCDTEFKLLCNEFVKTGKFNSAQVVPILDKMNQVNMNFTDNNLKESVSNVQSEKET